MKRYKVSILASMNRLAITIFYVFVGVTSFAQPSVFEHPQKHWRYSCCYYADFRPVGIPDTGADIEVYDVGEVERNNKTYRLAYRVRGYMNYNIPSMVDTLLYRWQGSRAYANFEDMCRMTKPQAPSTTCWAASSRPYPPRASTSRTGGSMW